jgi:outer membrane protein assembly factor BamB
MTDLQPEPVKEAERKLDDLVFVGFNSRVAALDRYTGEIIWSWKSPQGSGYVSLLLDGDRLVAVANGYVYCLDPLYGQEVWRNPMRGMGTGVTCVASVRGSSGVDPSAMAELARQAAAAAAANSGAV